MSCHDTKPKIANKDNLKKVLLMGNPNVGKSVIFSRLTGFDVVSSNYSGTTVSYTEGIIRTPKSNALLIDVPGIYSLDPTSKAEEVAVDMLNEGADLIICVLDATHLERNLHLALELQNHNIPIIYALNLQDVAKRRGIDINKERLAELLRAPVIETVAVKRIGLLELKDAIMNDTLAREALVVTHIEDDAREIAQEVTVHREVKLSFLEKLSDWSISPLTGIPIALIVLGMALGMVVGGGKALRAYILLPLVNDLIVPFIVRIVELFITEGMFYNILVGEYGVLRKGIEWPFALILPYVLLFYIVFSFLEDSGYLPRLGVLMDGLFKKIGLPGSAIIPFIMGYGCAVPAILGTRASTSQKERIIIVTLIAIAIPCTAQTGAFILLLGDQSILALIGVYLLSFFVIFITGLLMHKILKGYQRPLIIEIPNLLLPDFKTLTKKIWLKLKHFLFEAEVPMLLGILLAALIVETGALTTLSRLLEPLVVTWLGLPEEASLSLLLGIIRRELAVMPLLDMNLTTIQLFTGSIVALFYLPCISVFAVLIKEFKLRIALLIALSTFFTAFLFGGLARIILTFFFG